MPIDVNEFHHTSQGKLAFRRSEGESGKTVLVWLSGLRSDMLGGKASMLHAAALAENRPFLRFDYRGHGLSDCKFEDTVLSDWREDALTVIDELTDGPVILVGSSMGGCVSLLSAIARPERVKGLMLVAPAPDFLTKLMWNSFPPEVKKEIQETGSWMRTGDFDAPYPITRNLIEDGRNWEIMDDPIKLDIPVRILQGQLDDAVPWEHAQKLVELITHEDVQFTLLKDGDHRLSRPQDLMTLKRLTLALADQVDRDIAVSA